MPLTLEVSKQQRKADLSLGISVRTGLGDSEVGPVIVVVIVDATAFPLPPSFPPLPPPSLPPSTPSPSPPPTLFFSKTNTQEWITGPTTLIPGAQLNLTLPIVPCRETVHALIMRVVNSTETLVLEQVSSYVQGEWQRSLPPPCMSEIKINQFKTLIDLGVGAGL